MSASTITTFSSPTSHQAYLALESLYSPQVKQCPVEWRQTGERVDCGSCVNRSGMVIEEKHGRERLRFEYGWSVDFA
jgi:hypothetical protein